MLPFITVILPSFKVPSLSLIVSGLSDHTLHFPGIIEVYPVLYLFFLLYFPLLITLPLERRD